MRLVISILAVCIIVMLGYLVYTNWWPGSHGTIVVTSEPPGAQIWVDLKPTEVTTNGIVRDLPRGKHSVTVKLDPLRAEPFAQVVTLRKSHVDTLHFVLRDPNRASKHASQEQSRTSSPAVAAADSLLTTSPRVDTAANVDPAVDQPSLPTATLNTDTAINWRPDVQPVAESPAQSTSEDRTSASPDREGGTIQVTSSIPGARITINDHVRDEQTPAMISVPFGTYMIEVELVGYTVAPDQQSVRISRASSSPTVHFTLREQEVAIRAISVKTEPVEGRIFLDKTFVGEGTVTCERDYGRYELTFGEVEGWHAPKPIRVTLTPTQPQQEIVAHYSRVYHAFAQVDGEKHVTLEGIERWSTGVMFDSNNPLPSELLGPKIREIPGSKRYGWELAMGDPNRNPTGGDYVIFSFTLSQDVSPDSPLSLRLYVYSSARKYPFTLTGGRSEIVVEVNGRRFLDGFAPRYDSYAADLDRYEEWLLTRVLKPGENRILVYTGENNTIFNYLWKIEVL